MNTYCLLYTSYLISPYINPLTPDNSRYKSVSDLKVLTHFDMTQARINEASPSQHVTLPPAIHLYVPPCLDCCVQRLPQGLDQLGSKYYLPRPCFSVIIKFGITDIRGHQ